MRYSLELEFLRFSDNSSETHVTHMYRSFKWYIEYNSIFTTGLFKEDIRLEIFDNVYAFVISFENKEFLCEENTAIALSFKFNALIPKKKIVVYRIKTVAKSAIRAKSGYDLTICKKLYPKYVRQKAYFNSVSPLMLF